MKEDKLTPGTWGINEDYRAPSSKNGWITITNGTSDFVAVTKNRDNAKLIADAPELLQENKRLREFIERAIMCLGIQFDDINASEILKEALEGNMSLNTTLGSGE